MLALRLITLAAGGSGLSSSSVTRKYEPAVAEVAQKRRKSDQALISRGLVFVSVRATGIFTSSRKICAKFSPVFHNDIYKTTCVDLQRFTLRNHADFAGPLRHLTLFLSYVRKNEVKAGSDGTMFKKAQNDLTWLVGKMTLQ